MTHQHKPSSASNAVDDFVSRDVNQALQEARDILTKGKARKNSGERLIEDSTAIKVCSADISINLMGTKLSNRFSV